MSTNTEGAAVLRNFMRETVNSVHVEPEIVAHIERLAVARVLRELAEEVEGLPSAWYGSGSELWTAAFRRRVLVLIRREGQSRRSRVVTGVELIAAERQRQIEIEGWDAAHDRGHAEELALAGASYALPPGVRHPDPRPPSRRYDESPPGIWPWGAEWWKPGERSSEGRLRELVKAGALIAAAIDSASEAP